MVFKESHCSPKNDKNNISCLDNKLILKIAKILNKNNYKIYLDNDITEIHDDISKILKKIGDCNYEESWRDVNLITNNLTNKDINKLNNSFKPSKPDEWNKNRNAWLSNIDINNVLKQYSKKYNDYYYHDALPVDFDVEQSNGDCLVDNLCKFDINKIEKSGKTKIAMVFNTDPHNKSGEHWISLYIDCVGKNINHPCIYFFDSAGNSPPKEIKDFIDDTREVSNKDYTYIENDVAHQKGNTECGIYCLHFLDYMINGGNFMKYIKNKKNDKFMEKYRTIFFI